MPGELLRLYGFAHAGNPVASSVELRLDLDALSSKAARVQGNESAASAFDTAAAALSPSDLLITSEGHFSGRLVSFATAAATAELLPNASNRDESWSAETAGMHWLKATAARQLSDFKTTLEEDEKVLRAGSLEGWRESCILVRVEEKRALQAAAAGVMRDGLAGRWWFGR